MPRDNKVQSDECPPGKVMKTCPICRTEVCTGGPFATHMAEEHGVTTDNYQQAKDENAA